VRGLLVVAAMLVGQLGQLDGPVKAPKQHVMYVAEAQTVAAGKKAVLELRFRVDDGYHVNSHTPKSELQIATALSLGVSDGVKVAAMEYPAGKEYSFAFDPSEKLDVYSDDFVVRVPVVATAGPHELKGELKYQACDKAACYPPRTLPVDVVFTAK
jgi:hypothetical protein